MELDIYVYAHWNKYLKEIELQPSTYQRGDSSGDVLISEHKIKADMPADDRPLRVQLAMAMKVQLSELRAGHEVEQAELQENINTLLALEYKPEPKKIEELKDDIPF